MKASYIKKTLLKTLDFMADDPTPFVRRPGVDFSRKRKCPLSYLLLCMLSMEAGSLSRELRRFFSSIKKPPVSKSAFCQQREKLSEDAFPFLLSAVNRLIPFNKTFKGYHLLACDGSDVNIPPLKGCSDTYVFSNTEGIGYHQMHLNAVYDLLEQAYLDILIQPRANYDERDAFLTFTERNPLKGKCIYIADRGYFSQNVLARLCSSKHSFVLRVKSPDGSNSFFNHFQLPDSNEFDITIDFAFTRSRKNEYKQQPNRFISIRKDRPFDVIPLDDKTTIFPVHVRLVKIALPDGSHEFLVTDLPRNAFNSETLKKLYHLRWGIETSFRYLKYNIALNAFHAVRRDFIMQEIFARIILYNLTMLLIRCVSPSKTHTKFERKISVSDAIVTCRDFLTKHYTNNEVEALLLKYLTDIRPNRSFPRKKRSKRFTPLSNRV